MIRANVAVWLFITVSVLSFIAALILVLKGKQANAVLLGNGVIWFVIAVASAKKARRESKGPPAA